MLLKELLIAQIHVGNRQQDLDNRMLLSHKEDKIQMPSLQRIAESLYVLTFRGRIMA